MLPHDKTDIPPPHPITDSIPFTTTTPRENIEIIQKGNAFIVKGKKIEPIPKKEEWDCERLKFKTTPTDWDRP